MKKITHWLLGMGAMIGVLTLPAVADEGLVDRFDEGEVGTMPAGWFVPPMLEERGVVAELTDDNPFIGDMCLKLHGPPGVGFTNVMRVIPVTADADAHGMEAVAFRGQRIAFTAAVRVEPPAAAALWFRVDLEDGGRGFFDNMHNRPIRNGEWREYTITGDIADDAAAINFGLMLPQAGTAWIDNISIVPIGKVGEHDEPARELTARGLTNLIALTRLLGYVRYFHPSDEAAELDWDAWAIHAARRVEDAADDEALAAALRAVVHPIAPTVRIGTGERPDRPDTERLRPNDPDPNQIVRWRHRGVSAHVAPGQLRGPYNSQRQFESLRSTMDRERPLIVKRELTSGVWCELPIDLYAKDRRTLPRATNELNPRADWPPGWSPSANDRATRLAGVMLAWTVMQHFYPYFDVVDTDWDRALADALRAAAVNDGERVHLRTLRQLIADLHDGHGNVHHQSAFQPNILPLMWDWIDDQLVITAVDEQVVEVAPGDVVQAIDGRSVDEIYEELAATISGATEQWIRHRAANELITSWPTENPATFTIRRAGGSVEEVAVERTGMDRMIHDDLNRPENGKELAPGIIYINMHGLEKLEPYMQAMQEARGIVFDMRGYPGAAGAALVHHLVSERVTSPQWHIPEVELPDREEMSFRHAPGWNVPPWPPRLAAEIAFLSDGRAISYAESVLGIVEHYELGEIIGSPTAGTNGNVNPFTVPGEYFINWTGMKVLKHDGSQHHGIGILPTIPAERTIDGIRDGRDDVLEKAVDVLRERIE